MPCVAPPALDACLEHAAHRLHTIRDLDLSEEDDLYRALEMSKEVLGALAMYRGLLKRLEANALWDLAA